MIVSGFFTSPNDQLRMSCGRAREIGNFPIIIRPAFTLGGTGGGIAYNMEEFNQIVQVRADAAVHPHTPCPLHKENGD